MTTRGRPMGSMVMTDRRKQVLAEYARTISEGSPVRLAEIARRCGLYDYRDARRAIDDLRRMGAIA